MKWRKTYYFNEGTDGIICTSSKQRAYKMMAKVYGMTLEEFREEVKKSEENPFEGVFVETYQTKFKRGWVGCLY